MSNRPKVIEFKGKRYVVVGEDNNYYYCTEPWMEDIGELYKIPKDGVKIIA